MVPRRTAKDDAARAHRRELGTQGRYCIPRHRSEHIRNWPKHSRRWRLDDLVNPIGIMQGRLLPPTSGRIQSFPVKRWREEFTRAREADLACIEWIYEVGTDEANPLRTTEGIQEIHQLVRTTGVGVWSVC